MARARTRPFERPPPAESGQRTIVPFFNEHDLARSLATLAWEGRRRELFAGEFVAVGRCRATSRASGQRMGGGHVR